MIRARFIFPVVVCSAAGALPFTGCSAGKEPGGSGQAGTPGQAGASGQIGTQAGGSRTEGAGGGNSQSSGGSAGTAGTIHGAGGLPAGAAGMSAGAAGTGNSGGSSSSGGAASGGLTGGGAGTGGTGTTSGGAGGMGNATGTSSGCGRMPMIASDMYNNGKNIPIMAANLQRRYILSVPSNYDNTKAYKLIIAWHQRDGNDNQMYRNQYYHLQPLSKDSTIFVAPNGQKNGAPCTGTGIGESSCGWPNPQGSDMALADAVVQQVEENFCIDTNRIFATGWSFGGSMSYQVACERPLGAVVNGKPGFIRAIAVYSGSELSGNCTPSKPVGYYASHGTQDNVLCYDDVKVAGCQVGNGLLLAQNFAKANGCTWMTPTKVTSGSHVCTNLMDCISGYPVEFCSFNGGHTPDPTDGPGMMSWEYQNAWNFLNQF